MVIEYWIEQETRLFETDCSLAIRKIQSAKDMKQIKIASQVYAPHAVRYLQHTLLEYKRMCSTAENKMEELGQAQIKNLESINSKEDCLKEISKLKYNDWQNLRGEYAHIYRKLDRMAESLLYKKFDTK
jgi:hypothetical protein